MIIENPTHTVLGDYLGRQVKLVHIVVNFGQDVLQAQTLQGFQLAHLAGGKQFNLQLIST